MALLFMYPNYDLWTANTSVSRSVVAVGETAVVGFLFRHPFPGVDTTPSRPVIFFAIGAGSTPYINLHLNVDRTVGIGKGGTMGKGPTEDGGTILATTTYVLDRGVIAPDYHMELRALLDPTRGSVELRIKNKTRAVATDIPTSANTAWNSVMFNNPADNAVPFWAANVHMLDGSGGSPANTFLGECVVLTVLPSGAGVKTNWTPVGAATNWECLKDTSQSTYTRTLVPGQVDTFVIDNVPISGAKNYVAGVQITLNAHMTAGIIPCSIAAVVKNPAETEDYVQPKQSLTTTFQDIVTPVSRNPSTGAAWTEAEFNATEFGYRRIE